MAGEAGPVIDQPGRCPLVASTTFAEVTAPDVVVVPGELFAEWDDRLVQWLRQVHPTTIWTTNVCTGSLCLAAAGILDGVDATTHWARTEQLDRLGARYTEQRVVERGKVITAAGVSSGIDMTLTLLDRVYGPALAQSVRPGIEYDPQPPFDAGSPSKAPADIVDLAKAALDIRATTGPSEVAP